MNAAPDSLPPGSLIGGKYRIERLIGVGGFGAVYRAADIQRGALAAVKVLSRASLDQSGGLGRFHREAELASRLKHTHTVRVLDAGEDAQGWLYIAFELLVGRSVEQAVASEGAMAHDRAAAIVSDALGALEEAHRIGIIHRDIKPANLFLAECEGREVVKILDFGIAKSVKPGTLAGLTRVGSAMGTPVYMAPEQILGQAVGPASDLFSLGIVLADMVLGTSPYGPDPNVLGVVTDRIGNKPVPLPSELASSRMGLIIARATQPDPARRFQSAGEMRAALSVFAPTMRMDGRPSRDLLAIARVIGHTADPAMGSAKTEAREIAAASSPSAPPRAAATVEDIARARPSAPGRPSTPGRPTPSPVSEASRAPLAPPSPAIPHTPASRIEAPPATVRDPRPAALGTPNARRSGSKVGILIAIAGFLALLAAVFFVVYKLGLLDHLLGRRHPPLSK